MMDERREIREAIQAADNATYHLNAAMDCLRSAGNWGILDIFGGGMLSTFMKHNKMGNAERELTEARNALRQFAKELNDVDMALNINIQAGDFLGFADYFFDGVIADWMMQRRIRDARDQVDEALRRVADIRAQLQNLL